MATGGSGDVLSGIITGLAGQRQQTAARQNSESADTKGCANASYSNASPNTDVTAKAQSAQGLSRMSAWDAAICGVYIHGLAGDLAAQELGEYGVTRRRSGAVYGIRAQAHLRRVAHRSKARRSAGEQAAAAEPFLR